MQKNSREWTERTHSIIHLCSEKKLEQLRISDLSGSNHAFPELANLMSLTQIQGRAFQWEMWFNRRLHTEDWSLMIRFCGFGRSKAAFTLLYTMACTLINALASSRKESSGLIIVGPERLGDGENLFEE
ncbi:hypothetical protein LWI29_023421 [Acer saccharum]|uniref:Uncharacterized protein n=1 Tax=Acer saccharum TaxID=4024 RepID=A0AA39S9L8_ACESA|nr:hypothetical protein LWI29_023421 [Acer saccharum]